MKRDVPFKTVFQAGSGGYSSKRVFGAIGFLTSIGIAIACTIMNTQAPTIVIDIIYASVALLGVDSITGIWKTRARNIYKESQRSTLQEDDFNNDNYECTGDYQTSEEREDRSTPEL